MNSFLNQLKWQFVLLQKNNIIGISIAVTLIYAVILYFFKDTAASDKLLISLVLNDPSIIGYFFIALAIYTEIKHQVLPAIFVTPVRIHEFLITKILSISLIGVVCSIGLALSVKGFDFNIINFTLGSMGICLISSLLGLIMLTFTNEFLKFAMLSIPVFLIFVNVPLLHYLEAIDLGFANYFFPIQGSVDLIKNGVSGTNINIGYSYLSLVIVIPTLYFVAFKLFSKKIVHQ